MTRCEWCARPIVAGQRATFLVFVGPDGAPAPVAFHEVCKFDMIAANPEAWRGVPDVDLDRVEE